MKKKNIRKRKRKKRKQMSDHFMMMIHTHASHKSVCQVFFHGAPN